MKNPILIEAHKHSSHHRKELLQSSTCGCFYCLKVFAPHEITKWTDKQSTAICPHCNIDSVIGSASNIELTDKFLKEMHSYWFSPVDDEDRIQLINGMHQQDAEIKKCPSCKDQTPNGCNYCNSGGL